MTRKIFGWISGRLFTGHGAYFATPFTQKTFSIPLMSYRQRAWAYCTGASIVPLPEGQEPKNAAETEAGTMKVWNTGLWWREVDEESKYNSIVDRAPVWALPLMLPIRAVSSLYYLPTKAAKKVLWDNLSLIHI